MRFFAIAAALLTCSMANAQTKPADRTSDLRFFVGEWKLEGEMASPDGKWTPFSTTYVISDEMNGAWFTGRADIAGMKVRDFWGYDSEKKSLVRVIFQSNGVFGRAYSKGWTEDTLVWNGEVPGVKGEPTKVRATAVRKGPDEVQVTWEAQAGSKWNTYSKEKLTRQPSKPAAK
jgi:hypothetical protein